ncbi:MAG: alpha-glucosidase [Eubacteriales bacterium]
MTSDRKWWKERVIYQIYPRSFMDSNHDGIGDINGITSKLDYLKNLGIGIIWISPCFASPNADHGYDISDYRAIMEEFGSMDDFNCMLEEAHKRGIRIVLDLVVNHSSDEHPWFIESRKSVDNPYRDYYIWKKGKVGEDGTMKEPNNWGSFFTPSAWQYDEKTGEYYLHLFSKKQPDLNWDNQQLRKEIYDMMHFWLSKGVDGFRMDVLNCYQKPEGLPDSKILGTCVEGYSLDPKLYANNIGMLSILNEMREQVLDHYDTVTVGETSIITPQIALDYVNEINGPLDMIFHFDVVDSKKHFTWKHFKEVQRKWIKELTNGGGWNSQYFQNHDQPRCVTMYGDDSTERNRVLSAKMLGCLNHTMPGTPFVYQGEELGMTNYNYVDAEQMQDPNATFNYNEMIACGKSHEEAMKVLNLYGRAHSRTPMQWDDSLHAGFSAGTPWQVVHPNYTSINAKYEIEDKESVYHFYKSLIDLRRRHLVLVYGDFQEYEEENDSVFLYSRAYDNETIMVLINFTVKDQTIQYEIPAGKTVLLSNYKEGYCNRLRPFEATIFQL